WSRMKETSPRIRAFVKRHFHLPKIGPVNRPSHSNCTQTDILQAVRTGKFFGLVMVDLEVPEDLRSAFDRFPPIFVNREVGRNNIGPFMRQFAVENNLLKQPRRCLVSLHKAKRVLLISDLIRWYLDAGLIVTQVYFALQ